MAHRSGSEPRKTHQELGEDGLRAGDRQIVVPQRLMQHVVGVLLLQAVLFLRRRVAHLLLQTVDLRLEVFQLLQKREFLLLIARKPHTQRAIHHVSSLYKQAPCALCAWPCGTFACGVVARFVLRPPPWSPV